MARGCDTIGSGNSGGTISTSGTRKTAGTINTSIPRYAFTPWQPR